MASMQYVAIALLLIAVAALGFLYIQSPQRNTNVLRQTTSIPSPSPSSTATSTAQSTTVATTTATSQPTISGKYLMAFLACTGTGCSNPQDHITYLAQSNDGSNWTLVPKFQPYHGSVPDLVVRGGTIYVYNPGIVTTYNISTGAESKQTQVTLKYGNGTNAMFVDPSPILNSNGSIILFYLPGMAGTDPAGCSLGASTCTKHIMSATEVPGTNGASFVVDNGVRVGINVTKQGATVSDPAIFSSPNGYTLYVSEGLSTVAFQSQQLEGSYTSIPGLPANSTLVQDGGGVPAGRYNRAAGQYWTYVTYSQPSSAGVIKSAKTTDINSQIASSLLNTVVSGCNFAVLGCNYSVESPGVWPK